MEEKLQHEGVHEHELAGVKPLAGCARCAQVELEINHGLVVNYPSDDELEAKYGN